MLFASFWLSLVVDGKALAQGQPYPSRPIRVVVPYPPGGVSDLLGRTLAAAMSEEFGQSVIIDNKAGGGGALGSDAVAKAAPDGYTLLLAASSTHVINPLLYKLSYDPERDFAPVGLVAWTPLPLLVNAQSPAGNVAQLVEWIKSKPGELNFGSYGNGSASHLAGELFQTLAGEKMVHVPYKGSAPALADLMGGQISMMFSDMTGMQHAGSGKLRALAVSTATRASRYPDVPTVAEAAPEGSGLKRFEVTGWFAMLAPAGTPDAIVDRINSVMNKAMARPDVAEKVLGYGVEARTGTPQGLKEMAQSEREKWKTLIAQSKVEVE